MYVSLPEGNIHDLTTTILYLVVFWVDHGGPGNVVTGSLFKIPHAII